MNTMKTLIIAIVYSLLWSISLAQPVLTDSSYLGQTPPGNIPVIFAPGVISLTNRFETYPAFSPDGKEMFFSVVNAGWTAGKIFYTRERNGNWTVPVPADFSNNNYVNWESFISPDGNRQFFTSKNRPPSTTYDIWMVERMSDTSWTTPVRLNSPVNTNATDGSACVTNNGTLYFTSLRGGGYGGSIIYRAKLTDSSYSQVENMGNIIHTTSGEAEPFMAPDESYMIFISEYRAVGHGGYDLWICFRNNDSSWTVPVNMGAGINTANDEYGPRVTVDGKYLFFTRENRGSTMDIYWVSSGIIDSLRSSVISVNQNNVLVANEYKLLQNYPNPFNPCTSISFDIPKQSLVILKVYDAAGREAAVLVNETLRAGSYNVSLNAGNLSSGIYFYRLESGSFVQTRKMILLK